MSTYKSTKNNIELKLTGWDEPNNGRMLQVADLYVKGQLQNEKYFRNWNRLNENLSKFQFESEDGNYLYIPAESGGFVLNTNTLDYFDLPYKGLSTLTFKGNFFHQHYLVVIYSDEVCLVNLLTSTYKHYEYQNIIWAEMNGNKELLIKIRDVLNNASYQEIINIAF